MYLGLDVGTTYCAAVVGDDQHLQVVPLDSHETVVPSAVHITVDGEESFAGTALRRGKNDPAGLSVAFKRSFGDKVPQILSGHRVTSHELTERLLGWIGDQIVQFSGRLPAKTVITHPAHWERVERDLLIRAATSALDTQVSLLTEPEAIAIHYARERDVRQATLAVYDFGGGTFDATVVRVDDDGHHILGTPVGRRDIGGIDLDDLVRMWSIEQIGRERFAELDRSTPEVQLALRRLSVSASEAKETLSSEAQAMLPVDLPGLQQSLRITRGEFEEMARPLIVETVESLKAALEGADVDPVEVEATILAGGSSRVPLVSEILAERLGIRTVADIHPKLAVAMGAAASLQQRPASRTSVPAEGGPGPDDPGRDPADDREDQARPVGPGREDAPRDDGPLVGGDDERRGLPAWSMPAIAAVLLLILAVLVVPSILGGDDDPTGDETVVADSTTSEPPAGSSGGSVNTIPAAAAFVNEAEIAMGTEQENSSMLRFLREVVEFGDDQWNSVKDCQDHRDKLTEQFRYGPEFNDLYAAAERLPDGFDPDFVSLGYPDLGGQATTLLDATLHGLEDCVERTTDPVTAINALLDAWYQFVGSMCFIEARTNYLAPASIEVASGQGRCPEGTLEELPGLVQALVLG